MRKHPLHAISALLCLGAILRAGPAGAEDIAAAEALFERGLAHMKEGKYSAGCPALAESQRLDPRPGTLFTLAICEAEWGRVATAVTRLSDYLALYDTLPKDKQAIQGERPKVAAATRDKLLPDVPRLTIELPASAPAGTVVRRDGEVVSAAALGVALPVDPGEYTLTTRLPDGRVSDRKVTVGRGEKKVVVLEIGAAAPTTVAPPEASSASPPLPADGPSGRRVATYVIGGAGALGLVAGAVLGGLTVDRKGAIDAGCGAAAGFAEETACNPTGLAAANDAKALGLGSTIALAAGGAALSAAVVLFFTEPRPSPPRAGAAAISGPRAKVGVLSVSADGVRLGLEGAW